MEQDHEETRTLPEWVRLEYVQLDRLTCGLQQPRVRKALLC